MPSRPAKIRRNMPAVGRVIETAREKLGLSQNEAAARCGFTGTRWRHIVYGRRGTSDVLVHATPETWARMALVVGLRPEDLAVVRPDVSRELRELLPTASELPPASDGLDFPKLVVPQLVGLLQALREMTDPDAWQKALHIVAGLAPSVVD